MEPSDKIFGAPSTTSAAVQSFSDIAGSRLFPNPFGAVTCTTTVISLGSTVFGHSPVFPSRPDVATYSASFPFAGFNYNAPSFSSQSSTFSFTAAREHSFQGIAESKDAEVQLLFGKPVRSDSKKEQFEEKEKTVQPLQVEQLLFGKPVHSESKKDQSEEKEKAVQPLQVEAKRRWNAKLGN